MKNYLLPFMFKFLTHFLDVSSWNNFPSSYFVLETWLSHLKEECEKKVECRICFWNNIWIILEGKETCRLHRKSPNSFWSGSLFLAISETFPGTGYLGVILDDNLSPFLLNSTVRSSWNSLVYNMHVISYSYLFFAFKFNLEEVQYVLSEPTMLI